MYETINGIQVWVNSTKLFQNITNSTSPVQALQSTIGKTLPWFWPLLPFILYLWMFSVFSDSPGKGKIYMIAAIVFVISAFMAIGGLIGDAIINFLIFITAFWLSNLFKGGGSTVGG